MHARQLWTTAGKPVTRPKSRAGVVGTTASGWSYAYAGGNPVTNTDPTGLMLMAMGGSACSASTPGCPGYHAPAPGPGNGTFSAPYCALNISYCLGAAFTAGGGNIYTGTGYRPPASHPGYCNATACTSIFGTTARVHTVAPAPAPAYNAATCMRFGTGCGGQQQALNRLRAQDSSSGWNPFAACNLRCVNDLG